MFTLWDKRSGIPVYGGWASILEQRSTELLMRQVQQSAQPGPRAWHALNAYFPEIEEWGRTPLASHTSEQARCRSAAQADTVWGPGTRSRWEHEQHWRLIGELHNLSRLCTACGQWYDGAFMPHMAWHCPFTHAARTRPDAVVARVPWDVADAIQAWKTCRGWWAHLESGGTWAGFRLATRRAPTAGGNKVATCASQDGEPTVIPIEDVERLSRAYRKQTAMALK